MVSLPGGVTDLKHAGTCSECKRLRRVWLCNPADYSPPGFSLHGILQARILDRLSLLQGILTTQESNQGLLHCRWIPYQLSYREHIFKRITEVEKTKQRNWDFSQSTKCHQSTVRQIWGALCSAFKKNIHRLKISHLSQPPPKVGKRKD